MRLTVEDVAKAAGVSVAEVEKVQKVWDAAIQLGYASPADGVLPHTREAGLRLKFLIPKGPSQFLDQIENAVDGLETTGPWKGPFATWQRIPESDRDQVAAAIVDAADGVDGLGIIAHDDPIIRQAVHTVVGKGVPVVALFSDIQNCPRLAYVGIDNWSAGRAAAYLLCRFVRQNEGSVGLVASSQTYRGVEERISGFSNVMSQESPNLAVATVRKAWGEDDQSYQQTKRILAEYSDLVGIYNMGGGRQGAAQALRESGRGRDVVLIVHEFTDDIRPYVLDGTVDAVIDQNAKRAIDISTRWLLDHKSGRPTSTYLTSPIQFDVYFRENLP